MSENAVIKLSHLEKSFGENKVLKDIDLEVRRGEVISVIGSSGSGKSTMLRCINLLETPTGGEIIYEGVNIQDKSVKLTDYRAKVAMVFQQFNLFNNMTALDNCVKPQMIVLKRMKEELDSDIVQIEDEIKAIMGNEEMLVAGAYKVSWKPVTSSRLDSTALKKSLPDIAERFKKSITTRRFCVN